VVPKIPSVSTAVPPTAAPLPSPGFPVKPPEFHTRVNPADLRAANLTEADRGKYFHLSPFTTADAKELAPAQLAELIGALGKRFPSQKLALSCAPTPRERQKMEGLVALLPQRPWRVLAGNLNLMQLAAVIQRSRVHFCGDTGPFHLAVMTETPTVAWFWPNPGIRQWLPVSGRFRVLIGKNETGGRYLSGIATADLVAAAGQLTAASAALAPVSGGRREPA